VVENLLKNNELNVKFAHDASGLWTTEKLQIVKFFYDMGGQNPY